MNDRLTVYIDFKSPYAYLAIEPTRLLAKQLDLDIDWLPFVLDIPSYLGSAKLDASGEVAQQARSDNQWSKVKYAYYDCRRYANLRGMTIRGTVKIWDTNLVAMGMLWAKQQGDEILARYIDGGYGPFWKRELDVESLPVLEKVLAEAGATVSGFANFCNGDGADQNRQLQAKTFDQGIFGVPTYVLGNEVFFGREHLPRIRWQCQGAMGVSPDIAYELMPDDVVENSGVRTLDVGIATADAESCVAIPRIIALAEELDLIVNWYALERSGPRQEPDTEGDSRGARHRRYRSKNRERDQLRYMRKVVESGDTARMTAELLAENDIHLDEGHIAPAWAGMAEMSGYVGSPVFRVGDETFVGRQHLPLIRARFG